MVIFKYCELYKGERLREGSVLSGWRWFNLITSQQYRANDSLDATWRSGGCGFKYLGDKDYKWILLCPSCQIENGLKW